MHNSIIFIAKNLMEIARCFRYFDSSHVSSDAELVVIAWADRLMMRSLPKTLQGQVLAERVMIL